MLIYPELIEPEWRASDNPAGNRCRECGTVIESGEHGWRLFQPGMDRGVWNCADCKPGPD